MSDKPERICSHCGSNSPYEISYSTDDSVKWCFVCCSEREFIIGTSRMGDNYLDGFDYHE